jgi:hypothetical protein
MRDAQVPAARSCSDRDAIAIAEAATLHEVAAAAILERLMEHDLQCHACGRSLDTLLEQRLVVIAPVNWLYRYLGRGRCDAYRWVQITAAGRAKVVETVTEKSRSPATSILMPTTPSRPAFAGASI